MELYKRISNIGLFKYDKVSKSIRDKVCKKRKPVEQWNLLTHIKKNLKKL